MCLKCGMWQMPNFLWVWHVIVIFVVLSILLNFSPKWVQLSPNSSQVVYRREFLLEWTMNNSEQRIMNNEQHDHEQRTTLNNISAHDNEQLSEMCNPSKFQGKMTKIDWDMVKIVHTDSLPGHAFTAHRPPPALPSNPHFPFPNGRNSVRGIPGFIEKFEKCHTYLSI